MQELISVIVPVYNVEKYLENCIDSILNQTYKNLEIILVDDGSADKSSEICDNYSQQHSNIITIHKKTADFPTQETKVLMQQTENIYLL